MATLGARQQILRMSSGGVELRIVAAVDYAYVTIQRSGEERSYRELNDLELARTLEEYHAVGKDPARFEAFVSRLLRETS